MGRSISAGPAISAWLTTCVAALPLGCGHDFPTEPPISLTVARAGWPDTLNVTDVETLRVAIHESGGREVAGLDVTWRSSDPTVLEVTVLTPAVPGTREDSLLARLQAVVTARGAGAARIAALVDREGFRSAADSAQLAVVPLIVRKVSPVAWPETLTVTVTDSTSVELAVRRAVGDTAASDTVTRVSWRSTEPAVLGVAGGLPAQSGTQADTLRAQRRAVLVPRQWGLVDVIVSVDRDRFGSSESRLPVRVDSLRLQLSAALPGSLTVTDSQTVVVVRSPSGARVGRSVSWSSGDTRVLRVTPIGADSATVTALRRGTAAVVARVAPAGFEPAVLQVPVSVEGLQVQPLSGIPAPSLQVTDTQRVAVAVRSGSGPRRPELAVTWGSSDATVLQVTSLRAAGDSAVARVTALRRGAAAVIATVAPVGFEAAEDSFPVVVDTIAVDTSGPWPGTLTVTEDTTVALAVSRLASVSINWRSSDPSVLAVVGNVNGVKERAVLTARRQGSADVIATVEHGGSPISTFSRRVVVRSLVVDAVPGGALPESLTVTESRPAAVRVRNARDSSLILGLPVTWSSSDPTVLQVLNSGVDTTRVTALRRGRAVVIAIVNPGGTEPVELRDTIDVDPLFVRQDSPWPDTMAVTDSTRLRIAVVTRAGDTLAGTLPVRWHVGSATVLQSTGRTADVRAETRGWAPVTVVVAQAPFDTAVYVDSIWVTERWISLAVGGQHTCAVTVKGRAFCWGALRDDDDEPVGNGSAPPSPPFDPSTPKRVISSTLLDSITAGPRHTCALTAGDGLAVCWGRNGSLNRLLGVLGDGTFDHSVIPVFVRGGLTFSAIDAGTTATCAIAADEAFCWGEAALLGYRLVDSPMPRPGSQVFGGPGAASRSTTHGTVAISVGARHACATTLPSPSGWCWGEGDRGQIGNGLFDSTVFRDSTIPEVYGIPRDVVSPDDFTLIDAGGEHTCGLSVSGRLYCWGANDSGQLGDGTINDSSSVPVAVDVSGVGVSAFATVSAGMTHSCAVSTGGRVYCWGANDQGQLGDGTLVARTRPVAVDLGQLGGDTIFVAVRAGPGFQARFSALSVHTCGLTTTGAVYCWGSSDRGQLGIQGPGNTCVCGCICLPVRVREPIEPSP